LLIVTDSGADNLMVKALHEAGKEIAGDDCRADEGVWFLGSGGHHSADDFGVCRDSYSWASPEYGVGLCVWAVSWDVVLVCGKRDWDEYRLFSFKEVWKATSGEGGEEEDADRIRRVCEKKGKAFFVDRVLESCIPF